MEREAIGRVIKYDKLVRDRIPEILQAASKRCEVRVLDDEEFLKRLGDKLNEELAEYRQSGEIAELADLVEVIQALSESRGITWDEFERIRARKRIERGGFEGRILLIAADGDE